MPYERNAKECLGIKRADDEDRPIMFLAGTVKLVADVDANRTPPYFASVIEGSCAPRVDSLLALAPAVEILLHRLVRALYA